MGRGRHGPNKPREMRPQPLEAPPGLDTRVKIRRLEELRAKIRLARANYRVAPSRAMEIALAKLVREENELNCEVGFGSAPPPAQH